MGSPPAGFAAGKVMVMKYEATLKKDGKEIFKEKGNKEIEELLKELDGIVVKQK